MADFPSPQTLLPYGPVALLVDKVTAFDHDTITVIRTIRPDEQYGPGLSLEGIIELCAQSAACFNALAPADGAATKKIGVLAGAEGFSLKRTTVPGEQLTVQTQKKTAMGSLAKYQSTVLDGSCTVLAEGTLTVGVA